MIPVLLIVLMQAGGAYTHLPKMTLFPNPIPMLTAVGPVQPCSVHMPRMVIPKDVEFQIRVVKPAVTDPHSVVVPAPECPAPKSK